MLFGLCLKSCSKLFEFGDFHWSASLSSKDYQIFSYHMLDFRVLEMLEIREHLKQKRSNIQKLTDKFKFLVRLVNRKSQNLPNLPVNEMSPSVWPLGFLATHLKFPWSMGWTLEM